MYRIITILTIALVILVSGWVYNDANAAPPAQYLRNVLPAADNEFDLGSTTPAAEWKNIFTSNLTVSGTCTGCGAGSNIDNLIYQSYAGQDFYTASSTATDNLTYHLNNGFISLASSTVTDLFANNLYATSSIAVTGGLNAYGGGSLTGTWSDLGTVTTIDINGGTIDGTNIGASVVGSGAFNTLSTTGLASLNSFISNASSTVSAELNVQHLFASSTAIVDGDIFTGSKNLTDYADFYNGTFLESFNATTTSDGATVTLNIADSASYTGGLTMRFSDGDSTLATATSTTLTAGTDASPQENYVYILQSNKDNIVVTTTDWHTLSEEHIKIGYFLVPSAAFVQANGLYINQNWNDHAANGDNQGHLAHLGERERFSGAVYHSGVDSNGTDSYLTPTASNVEFKSTAGVVYQMHKHDFPAFDTSTGSMPLVKNWSGDAYHDINNLFEIDSDSASTTIGNNKYFNLVIWGSANKTGQYEPIMINLPGGSYNSQSNAENDTQGFDDLTIPDNFNSDSSTGFLIARMTIKMGTTWDVVSTVDLRGLNPVNASGGTAAGELVNFADNTFTIFDEADITKIMAFDVGTNVTTGNTRTLSVPDASGTLALLSAQTFTGLQTFNAGFISSASSSATTLNVDNLYASTSAAIATLSVVDLTSGGVVLGGGVGVLTDTGVIADSTFLVGDGSGAPALETTTTLRTSIGVGTGDSPQFTGLTLTADLSAQNLFASSTAVIDGVLVVDGDITPLTTDSTSLGTTALNFSDLFLDNGGVINFNADVTLTHTSNTLTITGGITALDTLSTIGTLILADGSITDSGAAISFGAENLSTSGTLASGVLTVTGAILPNADDGGALGASGTEWSDLFLNTGGVINFEAGDVTLTHASNDLNLGGGTFTINAEAGLDAFTVGSTTALFSIDPSGNVGVGSSTPFTKFAIGSGSIATTEEQPATSTTMTIDWKEGNQKNIVLGAGVAHTLTFSNYSPGMAMRLVACQNAGGSGTIVWGTKVLWDGGSAPTLTTTADKCDLLTFLTTNGTSSAIIIGSSVLDF